jgi:hypothetical protein
MHRLVLSMEEHAAPVFLVFFETPMAKTGKNGGVFISII